jgi:hypothetical protein
MKRKLISLVVILVGIGVGAVALAQGRHDEKPHGMVKQEAAPAVTVAPGEGE